MTDGDELRVVQEVADDVCLLIECHTVWKHLVVKHIQPMDDSN
jgi:hypothetical protein